METEASKMTKQPSYRFAGFEDDWKEVKVSDIFRVTRGQVLATTEISEEKTDTHKYPVYSSQTKNEGLLGYYDKYLFETAITWTTDGANAGTVNYREGKFYSTNVNGVLLSDEGFANKAIAEILNNKAWRYVSKVGNPKLMNNVMSGISLIIPNDFREISTLSTFFQDIDQLISLQQCKLEVFKEQKKTYLKLLFPAKGQTKPALRFTGFKDDWTSVLLGDISELYQPKTISSEDLLTEGFPVFGANGYIGYYKDYNHKENQVTISARGEGTGTPSFVEGPVWITGNSMVVNVEKQDNITKPFLYAFCLSFDFKPFVTGGAQPQLTREVLKKVNIMLPSLSEQEAIGSFFQNLDKAIAKQEEKVNQLKESKQILLRKMFI